MKCRGNDEIKIGTRRYEGKEDTALKKKNLLLLSS